MINKRKVFNSKGPVELKPDKDWTKEIIKQNSSCLKKLQKKLYSDMPWLSELDDKYELSDLVWDYPCADTWWKKFTTLMNTP